MAQLSSVPEQFRVSAFFRARARMSVESMMQRSSSSRQPQKPQPRVESLALPAGHVVEGERPEFGDRVVFQMGLLPTNGAFERLVRCKGILWDTEPGHRLRLHIVDRGSSAARIEFMQEGILRYTRAEPVRYDAYLCVCSPVYRFRQSVVTAILRVLELPDYQNSSYYDTHPLSESPHVRVDPEPRPDLHYVTNIDRDIRGFIFVGHVLKQYRKIRSLS